ncbi:hypothetical protein L9F63_010146, partial [Diploptera punctata]
CLSKIKWTLYISHKKNLFSYLHLSRGTGNVIFNGLYLSTLNMLSDINYLFTVSLLVILDSQNLD